MTTFRTRLIAAGFIGTIVGAGATGASAQGVYLEVRGFGLGSANPRTRNDATGALRLCWPTLLFREAVSSIPAGTSATVTGCAIATGIN